GALDPVAGAEALDDAALRGMLREIVSAEQWESFERDGDVDFGYSLPEVGRFRANYFVQDRGAAAVFRRIPEKILPLDALGLPQAVGLLADLERGLVLVTGPTGSGKSTTLASLVDRINRSYARHVVTIEDPIEFVHHDRRCVFSQREVGTDTDSFAEALRAAMRQDADVILVGELRDLETISLALAAAEMGTLVLATLHTNSAAKTVDRIVDVFPAEEQSHIRVTLAESLAAVVSQILLPTADGKGRCAATEILFGGRGVANAIREQATPMLRNLIQAGSSVGMRSMDDSLVELCRAGTISYDEGYRKAMEKERFERLAGG
ncbi:MAG: PilT/PilU family type 4a pilus ATPase, partial [Thermoanaerobaculia bacterium]|nr:PilT/PilU family type 4a pilus ATPase [Thermoanaerobaculia bacterium]